MSKQKWMSIELDVNRLCSLRCKYCFVPNEEKVGNEMRDAIIPDVVEWVDKNSIKNFSMWFFGIEPSLSFPKIKKIVDYLRFRGRKFNVGWTSNCTVLKDEWIPWMKKVDWVVLGSFDGPYHNKYRVFPDGSGSKKIVVENIKKYLDSGIRITLAMSCPPGEESNWVQLIEEAKALGVHHCAMNKITDSYGKQYDFKALQDGLDNVGDWYFNEIESALEEKRRIFEVDFFWKGLLSEKTMADTCGACKGSIAIGHTGKIYTCHRGVGYKDFEVGNIWAGVDDRKILYWRNLQVKQCHACPVRPCGTCWIGNYLNGGRNDITDCVVQDPQDCLWLLCMYRSIVRLKHKLAAADLWTPLMQYVRGGKRGPPRCVV